MKPFNIRSAARRLRAPGVIPVLVAALLVTGAAALAHDTWVQTNTNIVRVGDAVHVDLMLGNHGNDHRDFKLAGKARRRTAITLDVVGPDGKKHDLKPALVDLGYAPKEGYWTTKFQPTKPGLYTVAQTSDAVVELRADAVGQERQDVLRRQQEPGQGAGEEPRLRPRARPRAGAGAGRRTPSRRWARARR